LESFQRRIDGGADVFDVFDDFSGDGEVFAGGIGLLDSDAEFGFGIVELCVVR